MRSLWVAAVIGLALHVRAVAPSRDGIVRRELPNSPNGYIPSYVNCPDEPPFVRAASSMSPNETTWVEKRRSVAKTAMREFLIRMDIPGFDAGSYVDQHGGDTSLLPNIGLAFSGGGWRALQNGAGVLAAFDSRTPNSTSKGHIGGLLQSATYITGLSGGSWLVSSIYANNFTSVVASINDTSGSLWEFGNSIFEGPDMGGVQIFDSAEYWTNVVNDVRGKAQAGFNTSITDLWGRTLSYQLINATTGGESYTFSSIALTQGFQDATQPFPMIVADSRSPGEVIVSMNSTIYEFNPFEMGSWDADVYGFTPTQYLGTNMTAGNVTTDHQCVVGYDNAGFVLATSSTLFNMIIAQGGENRFPSVVADLIVDLLNDLSQDSDDIANYSPNPFYGWNNDTNPAAQSSSLSLVDGGEDWQTIPFYPLIQPARSVDVIFATDSGSDTSNIWPNGTSLVATFERSLNAIANGTGFPYIPDINTILNLGLNTHPTFFGCNSSNGTQEGPYPLVVWLPNTPYIIESNISTTQVTTNNTERDTLIQNGYDMATMANSTLDSTWSVCVACAVLSRSWERTNTTIPAACSTCFAKFCWNGTLETSVPQFYAPTPILAKSSPTGTTASHSATSKSGSNSVGRSLGTSAMQAMLMWSLLACFFLGPYS